MTRKLLVLGLIFTAVFTLNGCAGKVSQSEKSMCATESNSETTLKAEMQTESIGMEEPTDSSDSEEMESKPEEVTVTELDTTKEVITETPTPIVTESKSESETKTESEKKQTVTPTVTPTEATKPGSDKTSEPTQETVSYAGKEDCKAVADKIAAYLNSYRSAPATKLSGMTAYAEYRSRQLVSNFAHDTNDERAAATALRYGVYVDTALYGMDGEPYYEAPVREAIAKAGYVGTIDEVAEKLALLVKNSSGHWAYVGSPDYPYIAVGVTYESGMWYCDIAMAKDNTCN